MCEVKNEGTSASQHSCPPGKKLRHDKGIKKGNENTEVFNSGVPKNLIREIHTI
jgi:hypothetical protein